VAVRPLRRGHRTLNRAVQLVNASAAWNTLGGQGNAGAGMKIAIIDTGIDQTHPAFQDSSLAMPAGFPKCTAGHPEDCAYTNNKVIVARSYVRQIASGVDTSNPAATSTPDDYSPRDRDGHGTAVASITAANVNNGTVTFNGVAPKAYLGNYKVYGTDGVNDFPSEDIYIMALEDALNDGMDVANFSSGLSALTGPLDTGAACGLPVGAACDPLASAFETAAHAGMAIAVSAGNDGSLSFDEFNGPQRSLQTISTPGTAPSVITAGATLNSHVMQPGVSVNSPSAPANVKRIPAQMSDSSFFPSTFGANQGPLIDVATVASGASACGTLPGFSLYGVYALIQASSACDFSTQASNAQSAGATGIIFYSNGPGTLSSPENIMFFGPVVLISNSDGLALKSYIDANPGQMTTIDTAGTEQDLSTYSTDQNFRPALQANQLASYSSLGPAPDGSIKPDLAATGGFDLDQVPDHGDFYLPAPSGMYTAGQNFDPTGELYTTNRYVAANGTSFAAPMTAGAAALVKQAHPGYNGAQIKSALVNSASISSVGTDDLGNRVDVEDAGAGLLNAGAAVNAVVTAAPASF
ncbi:MAG: S8 family serine peptidase, partial [Bryobacteraceae bacterium]